MKTVPEAMPKMRTLIQTLQESEREPAQQWLALIRQVHTGKSHFPGGMSGWFQQPGIDRIDALQVAFDVEDRITNYWEPGIRRARWNPFGVRFFVSPNEYSERRFRNMWTLASDEQVYIGYDRAFMQIAIYHRVDGTEKV